MSNYSKVLFRYVGRIHKSHLGGFFQDHHTVCLIKADGVAKQKNEIPNRRKRRGINPANK